MNDWIAAHQSVKGYLHIVKGIEGQDSSDSFQEYVQVSDTKKAQYCFAAVADGHGDASVEKAADGSRLAVESAKTVLCQFCREYVELLEEQKTEAICMLENTEQRRALTRRLSDTIFQTWYQKISQEEGIPEGQKLDGTIRHLYGTTLLSAVKVSRYLILFQQGDGACTLFFEDGHAENMIPEDDRCFANVTTSMSDSDAPERMRSLVIDLEEQPVISCFLCSDGIVNSFSDQHTGTSMFCRELGLNSDKWSGDWLSHILYDLSKNGSGDDMSVAMIADTQVSAESRERDQRWIREYRDRTRLQWLKDKLQSMERKKQVLYEKKENARAAFDDAEKRLQLEDDRLKKLLEKKGRSSLFFHRMSNKLKQAQERFNQAETKIKMAEKENAKTEENWHEYNERYQEYLQEMKNLEAGIRHKEEFQEE